MQSGTRFTVLTVAVLSLTCAANAQNHVMRYADVHGDKIVFTYEGDLWLASTGGGNAARITSDPGSETWAKFSPDGSQIAFTGQYDGGSDVYVMDAEGGVPTRLTYHPMGDSVLGWLPDGKHILFRSRRAYPVRGEEVYKVSVDGGMPIRLPVDRAGLASISPDGKSIAYNRITREQASWKRHKGGTAQEIWVGRMDKLNYKPVTDWVGTDNFPMWAPEGIFFTSDREFGTLNLYKLDPKTGDVVAITRHKNYDVKYPSLSSARDKIVYKHGEQLWLYEIASGETRKIDINIASDRVHMRTELVSISPSTGSFGLSPSGTRAVLEARGEIINVPVEDGEAINLTARSASREKSAAWSPDGKWIAFISDKTGEEELYLIDQKAEKPWKQLTEGGLGFRMQPVWSPDSNYLIFSDKFMKLNLVDANSGKITVLDTCAFDDEWERWGIQDYCWSPDSKWIAYTKMERTMYEAIFLYSMEGEKVYRVTDEMNQDWSPSFSLDGKYLYFLSNRTYSPTMGLVDQNHIFLRMTRPYIVLLADDTENPFAPKDSFEEIEEDVDEEGADEEGDVDEGEDDDGDDEEDDDTIDIDVEGLSDRVVVAGGVGRGNYYRLEAIDGGFLYLAEDRRGFSKYDTVTDSTGGRYDLYHYDLEDDDASKVISGIANYHLTPDAEKLIYRAGSRYGVVDAGSKANVGDGQVDISSVRIKVNRIEEYLQMLDEAYRIQRDWFYDPNMHGVDWDAMRDKYRKFVPECGHRSDLTYLIQEMIGELNIGHTYSWGGDEQLEGKRVGVGMLGAQFNVSHGGKYPRVEHIIPGIGWDPGDRSPLGEVGCPIKEGDYILAIDGHSVTTDDNIYSALVNKSYKVVTITYSKNKNGDDPKTYRVRTIGNEIGILYREWVEGNRQYVDKMSNGQIGYVHIPAMGAGGLTEFGRYFYPQYYKKGFIVDERYNGGGFTGDMIIDRLERKLWGMSAPREGEPWPVVERCFIGHWALLVNEDTASNGEFFASAIQIKNLAPVIGTRTWGGSIGIEPHQDLVDGGTVTPPQFGLYDLNREWLIEGTGVIPDIEVQNWPGNVVRGMDEQLDFAVKYLLDKIKKEPREYPAVPSFPDKSKKNN